MAEITVKFTDDERAELTRILSQELEDTRVEVHRTHSPEYRDQVKAEEDLIREMLRKLSPPMAQAREKKNGKAAKA